MNCNPFTYSYASTFDVAKLIYNSPNIPFNKLEKLLKIFHSDKKGENNNKFCIFTNKCPNLSLQHKDNLVNAGGTIFGNSMEWPLFQYPVEYSNEKYYNFLINPICEYKYRNNIDCAKIIQDRKELLIQDRKELLIQDRKKLLIPDTRTSFFHTFGDLNNQNNLKNEIELIRNNQTDKKNRGEIVNIGFCLFITSCRSNGNHWE